MKYQQQKTQDWITERRKLYDELNQWKISYCFLFIIRFNIWNTKLTFNGKHNSTKISWVRKSWVAEFSKTEIRLMLWRDDDKLNAKIRRKRHRLDGGQVRRNFHRRILHLSEAIPNYFSSHQSIQKYSNYFGYWKADYWNGAPKSIENDLVEASRDTYTPNYN